jgi:pantoate--beta-alanine ligase
VIEVSSVPSLKEWVRATRGAGKRIGFVPTMGFLHDGHLDLVAAARRHADAVAMSIFVNPLQFGPNEDLSRYPRDLPRDRALAESRGVDLLFAPGVEVMYPPGSEVRVTAGPTARRWEGEFRPGHFDGVLTVVAKLFHLVEPDVAVFGQKDFQQATLIRGMVRDLDFPVEVVVHPTRRDHDNLALSSRNVYLSAEERGQALGLSRALKRAHEAWTQGERRAEGVEAVVRAELAMHPGVQVEYIAVADPDSLEPVETVNERTVVMLAARVGHTRLIDNAILSKGI